MRAFLRKATAVLGFTTAVTGLEIKFEDDSKFVSVDAPKLLLTHIRVCQECC